jgi:hypothetical protein
MTIEGKLPIGYYVYTINVDDVVRYIGKGKGLRLYFHMNAASIVILSCRTYDHDCSRT